MLPELEAAPELEVAMLEAEVLPSTFSINFGAVEVGLGPLSAAADTGVLSTAKTKRRGLATIGAEDDSELPAEVAGAIFEVDLALVLRVGERTVAADMIQKLFPK